MNLKKFLIIALALPALLPAMGFCFEVTAHVDKTQISMEDSLFLTVEVIGGKADLDLSMISRFKVISRGSSSSYNYINGKSERKASYTYVLIPLATGELKIPPITAQRDGKIAKTREIIVQVSDQVVTRDEAKVLFARSELTKTHVFAGEQAVYTLSFFTSKRLSGLGFERAPGFKDLSSKPFEKEKTFTQTINGVLFQVTQVNYILTPSTPGTFTIDPAVLVADVIVKSNPAPRFDSFFNDSFFGSNSYKPVRVTSNPLTISVDPLPPFQGNLKFSGLVGRFEIQANVDKTSLKAGESATLTLKISGSGNVMDAGLPKMDLPKLDPTGDAFKVYDDNPVETVNLTQKGYEGEKIFKRALVPVHAGKYTIDPVALVYFDVDQRAYKTVFTDPIHLEVTPSVEQHQAVAPTVLPGDHPPVKQGVDLVNKDILEIKEGLSVLKNYREIEPLFFALFMLIPAALFAVLKLFVRVSQKDVTIEQQMAQKAKYHLKQALKTGSPKKEYENTRTRNTNPGEQGFLAHLYSALVAIVLARAKKKGETVTAAEAQTILRNAQVEEKDINEITGLIDSIESARFGGNLVDKRTADQLLSRTKQMMKLLCLVLALAAVSALAPEKARADVATIFSNGIKSYQAGDFKAAAAEFERLAEQPIKNPFLFYNIGNAYLKAGDLGRAILWYERARAMAPNDPDLNFNLAHADTLVKDKKERDINVMEVLFFWDRLVSNKTIQISAIFSCFVFFAWAGIRVVKKQHIFSGLGMILLSILVLLSIVVSINYTSRFLGREAVIIKEEVAVRSGMTDTATELFALHAGSRVRVEEKRNGYLKIVFSKGRVGWVKDKDALII